MGDTYSYVSRITSQLINIGMSHNAQVYLSVIHYHFFLQFNSISIGLIVPDITFK